MNEIDNRGSTFYLAMYWARALADQDQDSGMKERFSTVAGQLEQNEGKITGELLAAQGSPVEIGGYFQPDEALVEKTMRPSPTFNAIIDGF